MPEIELSAERQSHILGVLLLALCALTAASLATYEAADWPHHVGISYHNACGPVGAFFAFGLHYLFGHLVAWGIPVLLGAWGWNRVRTREAAELLVQSAIGLAVGLAFSSFLGLWTSPDWSGHVGGAVASQTLSLLHPLGGAIFLGTLLTILLLVASEVGFSLVAQGIGAAVAVPVRLGEAILSRFRPATSTRSARRAGKAAMKVVRRDAPVIDEDDDDDESIQALPPARKPATQIKLPLRETLKPEKKEKAAGPRPPLVTSGDLPTTDLLNAVIPSGEAPTDEELKANAQVLERTLAEFGILGQVREVHPGPVVTMYEFEPGPGIKVNQIVTRADDLALSLRAPRLRILAPIPGKAAVGVEVPNPKPQTVYAREVMESDAFRHGQGRLLIALGKDTGGKVFVSDLTKCPHLLVAGSTGSGKSVGMNMILSSLLLRHSPDSLRLLLIDPKMLELTTYNGIPHLLWPVVTQAKPAARALRWTVAEMERRYKTLATTGVRHIDSYNAQMAQNGGERLPYIVVMVDELADLMLTLPAEIEEPIARLAQMARAVGIHLIVATQRPSVDVITGVIKANFPSRMAFQVASKVDSRTILDMNGADTLLGNGDMLYLPAGRPEPTRIHGAYISDSEADALAGFWRSKSPAQPPPPPADLEKEPAPGDEGFGGEEDDDDQLVAEAARLVVLSQRGSVSLLQRRLKIGYSRAGRIMDRLESIGVVGPFEGSQAREVLVDERFLEEHGYSKTSG